MFDGEPMFPHPTTVLNHEFKPRESVMARTFGKQTELDKHLTPLPFHEIETPLEREARIKFSALFSRNYNVQPPSGDKEPVRTTVEDIEDLKGYFLGQEGRRFYRYIDRRYHPDRAEDKLKDFLIVEEDTPSGGVIVAIFDYPTNPYWEKVTISGERKKVEFLKLRGCYAVKMENGDRSNAQAVDLTGFWQRDLPRLRAEEKQSLAEAGEPFHRGHRDEMSVQLMGLVPYDMSMTSADQVNLIKEDGYFFFRDSASETKWFDWLLPVAAFSQSDGDKTAHYHRSIGMLGMIRNVLGEIKPNEAESIRQQRELVKAIAEEKGVGSEETFDRTIRKEAGEWMRNRLAVALSIPLRLHRMGFDIIPTEHFKLFRKRANQVLDELALPPFSQT